MKKNYAFRFYEEKQICSRKWLGEGGQGGGEGGGAPCPFFLYGSEGDVKKFLLVTSDSEEETQGELDLFVTKNRLNETSFRRRLDTISKNIIRNKNLRLGDLEIRSRLKSFVKKMNFSVEVMAAAATRLTNFLTTMILILIFPVVMFRQYLIHHRLGELQEFFFPNGPSTAKTSLNLGTNMSSGN